MPKPSHDAMVGDSEDMSSWRERMRRYAIRGLKNQDIADIFFVDGNYPEYEDPILDVEQYNLGGGPREVER